MDVLKRNNVVVKGNGQQPIIFVHGYGCDQNMWRFVTPHFEEAYQVILLDHVGSGKSDWGAYTIEKYSNLNQYASDLLEVCEALDVHDAILVVHSVSAMVGALVAVQAPNRFKSMVMVCPSPCYLNDGDYRGGFEKADIEDMIDTLNSNYLGWSSSITSVIMGNADKPALTEELTNSFCQHDPAIAKNFAKVTFTGDHRAILPKITTPTLILQVSQDLIAPVAVGEYVHQHIKNSKMAVIEGTGHCPHLSHPSETITHIKTYLGIENN
jgi:sigma-B regulation protein RsbQ